MILLKIQGSFFYFDSREGREPLVKGDDRIIPLDWKCLAVAPQVGWPTRQIEAIHRGLKIEVEHAATVTAPSHVTKRVGGKTGSTYKRIHSEAISDGGSTWTSSGKIGRTHFL